MFMDEESRGDIELREHRTKQHKRVTEGKVITISGAFNKDGSPVTFFLPPAPITPRQADLATLARFGTRYSVKQ